MSFGNDIVAGTTLTRSAIRSPNYIPGVQGWTINRDGSSEFASGTFRGPVVVIDPVTGVVLASIGANGNGSFQNVYATGDVIIGTTSVLAAITAAGRGVQGYFRTTGTVPTIPGGGIYGDMLWCSFTVDSTRLYRVSCTGGRVTNTNGSLSEDFFARLITTESGGGTTTVGTTEMTNVPPSSAYGFETHGVLSPTLSGPASAKLQMTNSSGSTAYPLVSTDGIVICVEDIGPKIVGNGGTGSPAGSQQFTKQYFATSSQSYKDSGASESDPNNLYTGQLSGRSNGSNESSIWCFPGSTIRTDLSGATIQSAGLYMYCTGSSGATGSCFYSYLTNTTPPASVSSGGTTGTGGGNTGNLWPVPGWAHIDILSEVATQLIANLANAISLQDSFISGSASYYGAGNATFKPYIQITYTK